MHTLRCIHACIIKSRCSFRLLYNYDLNSFETFCITCRSGWFSVLRPAKPAIRLCMYTIIYIVLILICTGKSYLDCLKTLCFSGCSTHLSVCRPRQPSICLTMCSILNTQIFIATDGNLNTFQTLCLSGCSTHHTICNWVLPPKGLDVSAVRSSNICCLLLRNFLINPFRTYILWTIAYDILSIFTRSTRIYPIIAKVITQCICIRIAC